MENTKAKAMPTSIRLSPEVYLQVVERAKKNDRSVTKEIEHIIKKYLQLTQED